MEFTQQKENPVSLFNLRPVKPAKVSEISEATNASPMPAAERVNFHIGNPLWDKRLLLSYFKLISGHTLPAGQESAIDKIDVDDREKNVLKLFLSTIKKNVPYMPRGGYSAKDPLQLISIFKKWLTEGQKEPLQYDFGETSRDREVIICNGGIVESLRVFFHAISGFISHSLARIIIIGAEKSFFLQEGKGISFSKINPDDDILQSLEEIAADEPARPNFVLIKNILPEFVRRGLRELSLKYPLFFVEINNASNHLSIAREARMKERVLRFLTPEIFDPYFSLLAPVFVLGNSRFLKIIETVHFELKGTPAAPEIELLPFLLSNLPDAIDTNSLYESEKRADERIMLSAEVSRISKQVENLGNTAERILVKRQNLAEKILKKYYKSTRFLSVKNTDYSSIILQGEQFSRYTAFELFNKFTSQIDDSFFLNQLTDDFLSVFLKHHPEYSVGKCTVVSGSSRTALSLLGFHCGIREVISVDLGWTYEHCFPNVEIVALNDDLSLNAEKIKDTVQARLEADPAWKNYGAVIINNPHNASGGIFSERHLSALLIWLLEKDVYVIDDLSYQNVTPDAERAAIPTLRQIVTGLLRSGKLLSRQAQKLITVHSLSKTDCFAGARLAVTEIIEENLFRRFAELNAQIKPNGMAILTAYLFYRNHPETVGAYWKLRNYIFAERMEAIEQAAAELPVERNPHQIRIRRPAGSMYPQMIIEKLPQGVSLDWLSSGLARRGIGLLPLTTFARTAKGFELARKTFRLSLGGDAGADELKRKTRRVLIDLNRMLSKEDSRYNRKTLHVKSHKYSKNNYMTDIKPQWESSVNNIQQNAAIICNSLIKSFPGQINPSAALPFFEKEYMPQRLQVFRQRFNDRLESADLLIAQCSGDRSKRIIEILEKEFFKEDLTERQTKFRRRLFDRTVHPTQMYSLNTDLEINQLLNHLFKKETVPNNIIKQAAMALAKEYLGLNVPVSSVEEADELILDLIGLIEAEEYARWRGEEELAHLLSFWGDWDGSTRPSGQGQRLIGAVLMENVTRQTEILRLLLTHDPGLKISAELNNEIQKLAINNRRFWKLLNEITLLTNQLEKRYQSVLPLQMKTGRMKKLGMRLHLSSDPLTTLWEHNDRLEKRMRDLRQQRRSTLEYYFSLNKRLRKALYGNLPLIQKNLSIPQIALTAGSFRNLLKRFVLTPRIHQNMITGKDPFAINTTVSNLTEINDIAGKYGNPGMIMALQVSMASDAQALISLDRKMRAQKEQLLRNNEDGSISDIWLVPLFEDMDVVNDVDSYMDTLWDYALQSRRLGQQTEERFSEMICEVFIAGSDLSQQVSQLRGAALYRETKLKIINWLAKRRLIDKVRTKLGSGEPMQRQGGYYDPNSGEQMFRQYEDTPERLTANLNAAAQKSAEFARSPLRGVMAGGDLRTFQSNLAEKLRYLSVQDRVSVLYQVQSLQSGHENEIYRATEPLLDTRLHLKERGRQELEMLIDASQDFHFNKFLELVTKNFRQILYGRDEDVVGIHVISYFISRAMPALRDRPVVRPGRDSGESRGQKIIEQVAGTLPLSRYGSLLRAIGHNRAQTVILGVNQLSTGLFRALDEFANLEDVSADSLQLISERILPGLPVYDILNTLRIYHDPEHTYLTQMEKAFPAGNGAFVRLREDSDNIAVFMELLRRELIRRQGLNPSDFFEGEQFNPQLLPTVRPDMAVLLQADLFNSSEDVFFQDVRGKTDERWLSEIKRLLQIPLKVQEWRKKIWELIAGPIYQQVQSFTELALAVNAITDIKEKTELPISGSKPYFAKLEANITQYLRAAGDDAMQSFLFSVVEYLKQLPQSASELPIDIMRALRDVERIVKIEEQALSAKDQELLRFYILQIARLCGENG